MRYANQRKDTGAVHGFFSLSYANYLVLPRSILQDAPVEWQRKFVDLMDEFVAMVEFDCPDYTVTARGPGGKFVRDQLSNYRYPDRSNITWKT